MFRSLLYVNTDTVPGRHWLGNLYRIHQRLWMAFPDSKRCIEDEFFLGEWSGPAIAGPKPRRAEAGFLFRIERDGPARILVQSRDRPHWDWAFQNAPFLVFKDKTRVIEFEPAPQPDRVYRFRLLAHVVKNRSVPHTDRAPRRTANGLEIQPRKRTEIAVHPLPLPDSLPLSLIDRTRVLSEHWNPWRQWIAEVAGSRGFLVFDDPARPLSMQTVHTVVRDPSWKKPKRYNGGIFEGFLRCTDAAKLSNAIVNGIGHGKAFGFGLLSIASAG